MKFKSITFTFPSDLTEEEEGTFRANITELVKEIDDSLGDVQKKLAHNLMFKAARMMPMGKAKLVLDATEAQLKTIRSNLSNYIYLEKLDMKTLKLCFVAEKGKTFTLDPRLIIGKRMDKFLDEDHLIHCMHKYVFPDMKIEGKDIKIEKGEFET